MKRSSLKALASVIAGVALFAGGRSIFAQVPQSVVNSPHNLNITYGGSKTSNFVGDIYGNSQVCMPCHTPHQMPAQNIADNLGKLWNHTLQPAGNYKLYDASATSSSYLSTIDEVSRKCLGCHDGTIAVDSYGPNPGTTVSGTIAAGFIIGAKSDLEHDHPIDILYNSGSNYTGVSTAPTGTNSTFTYSTTWNTSNRDNDPGSFTATGYSSQLFGGAKTYTVPAISAIAFYKPGTSQTVTVTDTNPNPGKGDTGAPTTTDSVHYTHTINVSSQYVYCRSCHDPHNHVYNFMKVPNDQSQVCLTCHNK